jgi:hypothetical protein
MVAPKSVYGGPSHVATNCRTRDIKQPLSGRRAIKHRRGPNPRLSDVSTGGLLFPGWVHSAAAGPDVGCKWRRCQPTVWAGFRMDKCVIEMPAAISLFHPILRFPRRATRAFTVIRHRGTQRRCSVRSAWISMSHYEEWIARCACSSEQTHRPRLGRGTCRILWVGAAGSDGCRPLATFSVLLPLKVR